MITCEITQSRLYNQAVDWLESQFDIDGGLSADGHIATGKGFAIVNKDPGSQHIPESIVDTTLQPPETAEISPPPVLGTSLIEKAERGLRHPEISKRPKVEILIQADLIKVPAARQIQLWGKPLENAVGKIEVIHVEKRKIAVVDDRVKADLGPIGWINLVVIKNLAPVAGVAAQPGNESRPPI